MKLNPYLNYDGNCKEAFEYYEKHLGAKTTFMMPYSQMPGVSAPAEDGNLVAHASMSIGGTTLMASDRFGDQKYQPMASSYLAANFSSTPEAESAWSALSDGGQIMMPIQETFWAHRFGIVRDKFGVNWMIGHEKPMQ